MKTPSKIPQNLKFYREQLGLNQVDVARSLGVCEKTYRNFESGKNSPKGYLIERLVLVLKISPNQLFSWEDRFKVTIGCK